MFGLKQLELLADKTYGMKLMKKIYQDYYQIWRCSCITWTAQAAFSYERFSDWIHLDEDYWSSYKSLTIVKDFQYWIHYGCTWSCMGLIDTALKTTRCRNLTRRLVDGVTWCDCRERGLWCSRWTCHNLWRWKENKFSHVDVGTILAKPVKIAKESYSQRGELIDATLFALIEENGVESVEILITSPLFYNTEYGCCVKCYGINWATNRHGVNWYTSWSPCSSIVGEPGTQHNAWWSTGGIVVADVTHGLPRVEELFEVRMPKVLSQFLILREKLLFKKTAERDIYVVRITSTDKSKGFVNSCYQPAGSSQFKMVNLLQQAKSFVKVTWTLEVLSIQRGLREAQLYLMHEIQKVYESQGIGIHDKHFEVIIRKWVIRLPLIAKVTQSSLLEKLIYQSTNLIERTKSSCSRRDSQQLDVFQSYGVTRATMYSDSWLSAASFKEQQTILTQSIA